MPSWEQILNELKESSSEYDFVRRKYLAQLASHTGRSVILYATGWLQKSNPDDPRLVQVTDEDIQGIMTVIRGLPSDGLDLILHSPGGAIVAAEAFVKYLRSKFSSVRVIVPQLAMSAATMIACSADKIVLGKHSSLGPIDPQLTLPTPLGMRSVPAQAILDQFDQAQRECTDPSKLGSWMPMLGQYGPDLLVQCETALKLSRKLVGEWLQTYMFSRDAAKANEITDWLSDHRHFMSHGRHIDRAEAEQRGLIIEHLESDQELQDLVLSVYHATTHTFSGTPAIKIIENHEGKAFVKLLSSQKVPLPVDLLQQIIHPKPQVIEDDGPPEDDSEDDTTGGDVPPEGDDSADGQDAT